MWAIDCRNAEIHSDNWGTGCVFIQQMMIQEDIVLSFQGQMKLLINYQVFWSILHPLLLCHLLFIVSWLSFSSSSPVLLLLYSSSSSCRYAGMQWCICLWHTSSPPPISPPLLHRLLPSHWSQCFSLPFCHQQSISSLCWGLLLEREAVLQVNCAFVSIPVTT